MTELLHRPYVLPSASMGRDNPLPDMQKDMDAHAQIAMDRETISEEESRYMGWGRVNGILPYTLRDGYNRVKRPKAWRAVVLRNDYIEATFLPELGGRLWSLIDRETGRELLHRNPVFQPCNLALRNAWISGGVEWNLGIIGHTPFTVDPLYAEELALEDGTPVLRVYQYERVRHLTYRVEAMLPEHSRHLLVRVRVDNAGPEDTAVYWWSNMAVEEREDVRILVPAHRAYRYGYGGLMSKVPVPRCNGLDCSRTMGLPHAMDFFFDLPESQRRWIAALDGTGYGFCQTSTDLLQGRKLFVWGMGQGGRHWQSFLAQKGCNYVEIQAGLAHTQLEHLPMAGGKTLQWMEAYGALHADADAVQGEDWDAATACVQDALEEALPRATLDAYGSRTMEQLDRLQGKLFQYGDGWAALEQEARGDAFRAGGLRFPARAMGKAEREWLQLLREGALPCPDPLALPRGYQVNERWFSLLRRSIESGKGDHWFSQYHLGVMRAYRNDDEGARAAFERSLAHARSPWALRCLAVLAQQRGEADAAADWMLEAIAMCPQRQLAIEALRALSQAKRHEEVERVVAALPAGIRNLGRCKELRAGALLALGRWREAERILRGKMVLTDVREGEVRLTELWAQLCEQKGVSLEENPVPVHLNFLMQ